MGNTARAASLDRSKQFSAVTKQETKNEFGTRIAKFISSYVQDGSDLSKHEFRTWQKYPSWADWNSKNGDLTDKKGIRIKLETAKDQFDMIGVYDDRLVLTLVLTCHHKPLIIVDSNPASDPTSPNPNPYP